MSHPDPMPPPAGPPVLDASVALKWYLPEEHAVKARLLVTRDRFVGDRRFQTPELFFPECGSILWKRVRRGDTTPEEAATVMDALLALPFIIQPHPPLMRAALTLAVSTDRSVYDCLYLALAVRERTRLITADQRLYRALSGGPLARYLLWIEDVEEVL